MTNPIPVGTVETLLYRVYDVAGRQADGTGIEVGVQPGTYPLFYDREAHTYYWVMKGRRNERVHFDRLWGEPGEGVYSLRIGDEASGQPMIAYSRLFTEREFDDFCANDPICEEGGPSQRLRIVRSDRP